MRVGKNLQTFITDGETQLYGIERKGMSEEVIETGIKMDADFVVNTVELTYGERGKRISYTLKFDADRILTPNELVSVLQAVSSMLKVSGV